VESIINYMVLGAWLLILLIVGGTYVLVREDGTEVTLITIYLITLIVTVSAVSIHFNNL